MTPAPAELLAHWSAEFDCPAKYLQQPGTFLVRSADLALNRFQLLRTGASAILRVSSILEDGTSQAALLGDPGPLAPAALGAQQLIERLRALPLTMAWTEAIFCCDRSWERPRRVVAGGQRAALLRGQHAMALRTLIADAGEREAFLSGVAEAEPPLYGSFDGNALCAVAGCVDQQTSITSVRVLVDPRQRRAGHGSAAAAALISAQVGAGKLALMATSVSNRGAVRLARSLGMQHVAMEEGMELLGA